MNAVLCHFAADEVSGVPLEESDASELQQLLQRCSEFFQLIHASPVRDDEALILIRELPPGKRSSEKEVIGLRIGAQLFGVATILRDYPQSGIWFLGDLILAPESRGKGLGSRVYWALETWARSSGAHTIQLIVQEQNSAALRFWRRIGFEWMETIQQKLEHVVNLTHRMQRDLTSTRDCTS